MKEKSGWHFGQHETQRWRTITMNGSSSSSSNSIHFHGGASEVAEPVNHSALDFFERPSVLINYEGSHDQEVFPQVGCRGPQFDFVVTSYNRNLFDLNKINLDLEGALHEAGGKTSAQGLSPVSFTNCYFWMTCWFPQAKKCFPSFWFCRNGKDYGLRCQSHMGRNPRLPISSRQK